MKMRNGGDVPGVTGQRARTEIVLVIGKTGDDDFNDLHGKPGGRRRGCCESPGTPAEHVLRILARLRYQTRLMSGSIAVIDKMQSVHEGQSVEIRTT